ncbi:MAG: helix-turn-helix domain-containing protein [Chloroflexi bacterium]|nr:helix-turn-helix domain-containing protein [Chloroflexota bacterium]
MADKQPSVSEVVRLTRERIQLLDDEARRLGRDPATIGRVLVAGFSAATRSPWASVDAWIDLVGRFRELDFDEFVFPDPEPHEVTVFERLVATEIPRLRRAQAVSQLQTESTSPPARGRAPRVQ